MTSMIKATFFSLSGKFVRIKTETFENEAAVMTAAKAYAEPQGYSGFKVVDDHEDSGGFRITAKTPGGRGGRNIIQADSDFGDFL